jgi:hypothetical protein
MALAIFGCAAGKAVFCVGLCVENTAFLQGKATAMTAPIAQ